MDNDLIAALRDAGHTEQPDQIRDRLLANQLRDAGHENLADALEGGGTAPAEPAPAKPKTAREAEAVEIVSALRNAKAWPGDNGEAA